MTNRAAMLRRGPEEPQRATFLELFFDLAFVYALFQISRGLLAHLGWSGAFQTAVLLLAAWLVWNYTAEISNRYDPDRPTIQLLIIGSMLGALVLAVAVPEAFSARGLLFAGAYVAVQVGRSLVLVLVTRGGGRRLDARLLFWYGVSALPWLVGAFAHGWARGVVWALAVAVDYTASGLGWPTPGLGRVRGEEFAISSEFVAERQRQFVIVALGELILVTGLTVTSSRFGAGRDAAVVVAFATTVLLWRVYIYRAGQVLGPAVATAPDPLRVGISASLYAHPVMVAGTIAISVGDELVITHPAGHTQPAWIAVILGGPALFLAGRAVLEYVVFSRVSSDRVIGVLVLAAVSPAMIFAPPLLAALTATIVLAGVAIADTARARRHPGEPPSPRPGSARAAQAPDRPRNDELLAGNWIRASNLRRFSELVSSYTGYCFDHPDWQAIQAGLDTVTSDRHTFSYPLTGRQPLTLTISKDPGGDEVSVQVTGHQDRLLGARIAALTDAFQ
jgi:low temperature requirement protein LtrA